MGIGVQGDLFGPGSLEDVGDESIDGPEATSVYDEDERNGFADESFEVYIDPSSDEPENGFDDQQACAEEAGIQDTLFNLDTFTVWRREWRGMPEFVQEDMSPWKSILIHFESRVDLRAFAELISQNLTLKTQSVWYPEAEIGRIFTKRYTDDTGATRL